MGTPYKPHRNTIQAPYKSHANPLQIPTFCSLCLWNPTCQPMLLRGQQCSFAQRPEHPPWCGVHKTPHKRRPGLVPPNSLGTLRVPQCNNRGPSVISASNIHKLFTKSWRPLRLCQGHLKGCKCTPKPIAVQVWQFPSSQGGAPSLGLSLAGTPYKPQTNPIGTLTNPKGAPYKLLQIP